jgi:hypothetical protein
MRRRIRLSVGFLAVFSLGIALGHLLSIPIHLPEGGGNGPPSPDDKMWALANSWTDSPLLGQSRTYSEFLIQTPPPELKIIRRVRIEDSAHCAPHVPIDWREDGQVQWTTNGSAVTFSYDGPETSFQMTLKTQP